MLVAGNDRGKGKRVLFIDSLDMRKNGEIKYETQESDF